MYDVVAAGCFRRRFGETGNGRRELPANGSNIVTQAWKRSLWPELPSCSNAQQHAVHAHARRSQLGNGSGCFRSLILGMRLPPAMSTK